MGRIAQVDLHLWHDDDLQQIVRQGFRHLHISVPGSVSSAIAQESAGLPIFTQAVCRQLLTDRDISVVSEAGIDMSHNPFVVQDAYNAIHNVVTSNYRQFEPIYQRLVAGPRQKSRRYNTYEYVLSTFTQDPVEFSLGRDEILERLRKLRLPEKDLPPPGSVDSMLSSVASLQERIGVELLEWSKRDRRLYILEPSFLVYLRWREPRQARMTAQEILEAILRAFRKN